MDKHTDRLCRCEIQYTEPCRLCTSTNLDVVWELG